MQTGTITRLTDKGFGFIAREGKNKDLFFHSSNLVNCRFNDLKVGDKLEFEISSGPKGAFALNIHVLD